MPQFDILTFSSQIFWLLVSWGIVFVSLWKFLIPKMFAKLAHREEDVKRILSEAEDLDQRAEEMISEYDQTIQALKKAQKEKLQNVHVLIQKNKDQLEQEFKKNLEDVMHKYQLDLKMVEKQLFDEMPKNLNDALAGFIEKQLHMNIEDPENIQKLLKQEIKKVAMND